MEIERTFIKRDMVIHYILTDNVCNCFRHNPNNRNPYMGYDGKCNKSHKSVVECVNFNKI